MFWGWGWGWGGWEDGRYRFDEVVKGVNRCAVRVAETMGSLKKAVKPVEQRRHSILLEPSCQCLNLELEI